MARYRIQLIFQGIIALSGRVISGDVYAWSAVFILPINSALNPVLYTLTAILARKVSSYDLHEQEILTRLQEDQNYNFATLQIFRFTQFAIFRMHIVCIFTDLNILKFDILNTHMPSTDRYTL